MTFLVKRASLLLGLMAIVAAAIFGATIAVPTASMGAEGKPHLILTLKDGDVDIELLPEIAPKHVERIITLTNQGAYNGVVFHRVIAGFMAQTGDVKYGKTDGPDFDLSLAGGGDSPLPNVEAEFSDTPYERGTVGAARTDDPNSFNSQFFITFVPYPSLNGKYTVFGKVVAGMDNVDKVKKGAPGSGVVADPDKIISAKIVYE